MMNDASPFETLLASHLPMIARLLRGYEADPNIREELKQDIALALWRALPRFRGEADIRTYVARIVHNIGASHVRREIRRPPEQREAATEPRSDPATIAERDDDSRRLLRAVAELPLGQRQVVTLYLEGFTHRQTAYALGIAEGAVAVRLSRAKAALTKKLRGTGENG